MEIRMKKTSKAVIAGLICLITVSFAGCAAKQGGVASERLPSGSDVAQGEIKQIQEITAVPTPRLTNVLAAQAACFGDSSGVASRPEASARLILIPAGPVSRAACRAGPVVSTQTGVPVDRMASIKSAGAEGGQPGGKLPDRHTTAAGWAASRTSSIRRDQSLGARGGPGS